MLTLLIAIGLVFAPLGALAAFLITYEEWSHHALPRRTVLGRSVAAALVAGAFLLAISAIVGVVLSADLPPGLGG